jgi:hypothetical protein
MIKLITLLESIMYNSWARPSLDALKQEYRIEHDMKGHNWFNDEQEFLDAVNKAKVVTITPTTDRLIDYRSRTNSYDELVNLLSSYRSWGKYRNEDKLQQLYDRISNNLELDMPIVLKFPDGNMRVFSGNTRMDVSFQLGVNPQVLMVEVPK